MRKLEKRSKKVQERRLKWYGHVIRMDYVEGSKSICMWEKDAVEGDLS